jgi:hypothetical protein
MIHTFAVAGQVPGMCGYAGRVVLASGQKAARREIQIRALIRHLKFRPARDLA